MSASAPRSAALTQRRSRIEQIALELFLARGYDQVTVEDVCAAAGTAPATFYRYFGSKEEVVFAYRAGFIAALREALTVAEGAGEEVRLPTVLERFARFLESQEELLTLRDRIVLDHPRLLQGTLAIQRDLEAQLATGLAQQRGLPVPDTAALLEAGVGLVVLRVALRRWRSDEASSLVHATAEVLDEFAVLTSRRPGAVREQTTAK